MRLPVAALLAGLALACTSGVEREPATTPPPAASAEPSDAAGDLFEPGRPPESPPGARVNRFPTPPAGLTDGAPFRVDLPDGGVVEQWPSVVFADPATGAATVWAIPGAMWEFGVSPSGEFILWRSEASEMHLLRTDDGSDRVVENVAVVEYGPDGAGYVALVNEFFLVAFDGFGQRIGGEFAMGLLEARAFGVAWSPDGERLAYGWVGGASSPSAARVSIVAMEGQPVAGAGLSVRSLGAVLALEWSPDSQRLAVVTAERVTVSDRRGHELWSFDGDFAGNPRWSPDGEYLLVVAAPDLGEHGPTPLSYLFAADGAPLFRVVGRGACGGDPWLSDGSGFDIGRAVAGVDGEIRPSDERPYNLYPDPGEAGLEFPLGTHHPHWGRDFLFHTEDGRLLFTAPAIGHGGCAEGLAAAGTPVVQRPPYARLRRLPAGSSSNEAGSVTVAVVGDLMFARDVTTLMEERGVEYPFERVSHLWRDADVVIGNLEGTFTDRGEARAKTYTFRTPPSLATTLSEAGFDAVSLANNHAYDFGDQGLEDTIDALDAVGVQGFGAALDGHGASNPAIVELPGVTLALLAFTAVAEREVSPPQTPGVAWGDVEAVRAAVAERAGRGETVIVMLHAGDEYVREPSETQTALARAAIDAGATVVIGTHPHVLQRWERYGDGVILYSLGNFVFDLDRDDLATLGAGPFQTTVALITIDANGVVDVRFRPAYIDPDENRPRPATGAESAEILRLLGGG